MLWYGILNNNKKNIVRKLKSKVNHKEKIYSWNFPLSIQLNKQTYRIHKPFYWHLAVLKSKHKNQLLMFFYSNTYFFKLSLPTQRSDITYDWNTSLVVLHTLYPNNNYRLFWTFLQESLYSFYKPVFKKIKFKGKGYYIYKNKRNTITPQFGYSHRLYLYSYFTSVRFLSKTSIFIFGLKKSDVVLIGLGIKKMRPINIFTGRGVRFSRQIVYKKTGKVSSYR